MAAEMMLMMMVMMVMFCCERAPALGKDQSPDYPNFGYMRCFHIRLS